LHASNIIPDMSTREPCFTLVVTGASGAGKTAAVRALATRALSGVACFHFDTIGVPSPEVMLRDFGSGEAWQAWATNQWLDRLDRLEPTIRVAVLDGQTRPSFVLALGAGRTPRNRQLGSDRLPNSFRVLCPIPAPHAKGPRHASERESVPTPSPLRPRTPTVQAAGLDSATTAAQARRSGIRRSRIRTRSKSQYPAQHTLHYP